MGDILLARVYDDDPRSGPVYLVERLWPRGVKRDAVALEGWLKDVAPSTDLRKWFGHDPAKWVQFRHRYIAELDDNPASWQPLVAAAHRGDVTLLYSSRDREHNNAVVLRDYLLARTGTSADRPATHPGKKAPR